MTTLIVICVMLAGLSFQAESTPSYRQVYSIFIRGAVAGTESVNEIKDKDGNRVVASQHELLLSDGLEMKRMAFETTMAYAGSTLVPLRYSFKYLSGALKDYYEVTIKDSRITRVLSRGGNIIESSGTWQAGMLILDFNVYHQYDTLSRLYDFKKGGRQLFNDFMPVIGGELPLAVTWLEDSRLEYAKGSIPVRNFKIEFVGVRTGVFSTDMEGHLVRLVMREQDLEVVRKDLVPEK
jgi:hypothetical protein